MRHDLPRLLDRFDAAIAALCAAHAATGPGFSATLLLDGEPLRRRHHGMAELEWQQPLAGDTRLYLASESKPWVAALVLEAVADGRLDLAADLRRQLPALHDFERPVSAGHLLRHTSGIADYLFLWSAQLGRHDNDLVARSQALDLIERCGEPAFAPGLRYDYSNSNYVLLAEWLERDGGRSLAELARQRFFDPWRMTRTDFDATPWRMRSRRARSYERRPDLPDDWQELPVALGTWGDGGLWSTPDDLAQAEGHWLADWRRHGEASLLERCVADDARFAPPGTPYRFGLEPVRHGGRRFMFHGGRYAGFASLVLRCPEAGLALVLLANAAGFDASAATWLERLWGPPGPAMD